MRFPLFFGREEVPGEAGRLSNNPVSLAALENLAQVYAMLKVCKVEDFVIIDLAELRGLDYYPGIVFEGFTRELGHLICGGGRYDHLLGKYGAGFPATGFALDIERVMLALGRRGPWRGKRVRKVYVSHFGVGRFNFFLFFPNCSRWSRIVRFRN
ncbi:MAG: ATP phosphoribosyltransferase regulatory subunit [Candidatus Binatia bacterium]